MVSGGCYDCLLARRIEIWLLYRQCIYVIVYVVKSDPFTFLHSTEKACHGGPTHARIFSPDMLGSLSLVHDYYGACIGSEVLGQRRMVFPQSGDLVNQSIPLLLLSVFSVTYMVREEQSLYSDELSSGVVI